MKEETKKDIPQTPNFDGEKMKMPENSGMKEENMEEKSAATGPILIILGVLLLVILGGLYYWFSTLTVEPVVIEPTPIERPTPEENNEPESTTAKARTDTLETVRTSDEIAAIEAALEATHT